MRRKRLGDNAWRTAEEVGRTVATAHKTHEDWRESNSNEHRAVLYSIADAIDENTVELGELETRQNGKLSTSQRL